MQAYVITIYPLIRLYFLLQFNTPVFNPMATHKISVVSLVSIVPMPSFA